MSPDQNPQDPKEQERKSRFPQGTDKILGALSDVGDGTSKWMAVMMDETLQDDVQAAAASQATGENLLTMVSWIDKLFDAFQRYSFEFNKNCNNSDLIVNVERPTNMHQPLRRREGTQVPYVQGHLATRFYCLIIQGEEKRILGYMLPVKFLLGFESTQADFKPYLDMEAFARSGQLVWQVDGQTLGPERIGELAKRLFADIVRAAQGKFDETESFALDPSKKTKQEEALPPPPSYYQDKFELLRPEDLDPEAGKPSGAQTTASGTGFPTIPKSVLQGQTEPSNTPDFSAEIGDTADLNIWTACGALVKTVDRIQENLSASGVKAFQSQDLKAVEKVMRKTAALKTIKERLLALLEEFKDDLNA